MSRYLKLWLSFIKNCVVREMSFRLNFFIQLFTGSMWFFMSVLTFSVVFANVKQIAGWTKYEVFFLLGASHVILRVFMTFFMLNLTKLPDMIRTGELDFYMVKPLNTQFFISTRYFNFDSLSDTLVGVGLMGYAGWRLGTQVTAGNTLVFLALLANSVALYYAIMFAMVTAAFWFIRFQPMDVWWQLTNLARQPAELFPQKVQFVFTYCLPMLIIVNFPVKAFLGRLAPWSILAAFLATALMLWASNAFFNMAIRRYRSASS
jgi:ABC-2 type transport system permease protein